MLAKLCRSSTQFKLVICASIIKMLRFGRKWTINRVGYLPARSKNKKSHWSQVDKRRVAVNAALKHFDDFYPKVYGEKVYEEIRDALLEAPKYMAIVNSYGDNETTKSNFEVNGAINLRKIYELELQLLNEKNEKRKRDQQMQNIYELDQKTESGNHYNNSVKPIENQSVNYSDLSMKKSMEKSELDFSRIVDLNNGIGGERLYDFIPASKIKNQDVEWVTESEHFEYYDVEDKQFPVKIQKEFKLKIPDLLDVYFYDEYSKINFKDPRNCASTGVYNYLLLNGGSVLPVIALDVNVNDRVLDMCASPGAKSYSILQTLKPKLLVCNDNCASRVKRIHKLLSEYFFDLDEKWIKSGKLTIMENDARAINDVDFYDKILVDVPCTTDRKSVQDNDNNIFKSTRVRERLRLPEVQADILCHALKLVKRGGNVVYSTCTLSPVQNDGVVHMALKKIWEETSYKFVVKDLTPALQPLKSIFRIANKNIFRYGNMIYPVTEMNFGPTYLCKLTKLS